MNIKIAQSAGFCFGVDRAINMVYSLLEKGNNVCTLGPIIHNPQMVENLYQQGVRIINNVNEAKEDEIIVIRSHGVKKEIFENINQKELLFCDATCPFVAKIHKIVAEKSEQGYSIIITGDENHPETIGIKGHCNNEDDVYVVRNEDDIESLVKLHKNLIEKSVIIISQTTFNSQIWLKCVKTAKKLCTNLLVFDTICSATGERQREAAELSKKSDLMIVIGGRESSNTQKLKQVCSENCNTFLIEKASELDYDWFNSCERIGITAGASTPFAIIKEVTQTMSDLENKQIDNEEFCFEEALENSLKTVLTGEKVTGLVTAITPTEVQVEIGTKHTGYIPIAELTDDPTLTPQDIVKVGDEMELLAIRVNDIEGTVTLSKKRLDAIKGYDEVNDAATTGEILNGKVTEAIKGGVICSVKGVKVFVPASQATTSRNDNLEDLVGKSVQLKIIEASAKRRNRAVGSIKMVALAARKAAEEKVFSEIENGKVYTGVVKSLTSYGAFVDIGGVDGMVHISELSWGRIKHPSEIINVGDTVTVYVKDFNPETKKISLGYKKTEDNPWVIIKTKISLNDVVEAKVVSMTPFGAFVQIIPGIDGLIHISQISTERIEKPSDILEIGQIVTAKVTEFDTESKRISLSMRALIEEKEAAEKQIQSSDTAEDTIVASTDNMDALKCAE